MQGEHLQSIGAGSDGAAVGKLFPSESKLAKQSPGPTLTRVCHLPSDVDLVQAETDNCRRNFRCEFRKFFLRLPAE